MTDTLAGLFKVASPTDWDVNDQSLLDATLSATPAQRLAWLEEALHVAYASGALKPRKPITQAEWEAMGSRRR